MLDKLFQFFFGCRHRNTSNVFKCQRNGSDGKAICSGAGMDEIACLDCGQHIISKKIQLSSTLQLPPVRSLCAKEAEPKLTGLERMAMDEELRTMKIRW